jgi:hypothetical protein
VSFYGILSNERLLFLDKKFILCDRFKILWPSQLPFLVTLYCCLKGVDLLPNTPSISAFDQRQNVPSKPPLSASTAAAKPDPETSSLLMSYKIQVMVSEMRCLNKSDLVSLCTPVISSISKAFSYSLFRNAALTIAHLLNSVQSHHTNDHKPLLGKCY